MVSDTGDGESTMLSPDEAFSVLGNETRVEILQTLGEADGQVSFTDLRNRVGIRRGGQFNYHLEKVVGHFVEKTDDGYALRRPGERVVEAVLSGAVTEAPIVDRTQIDQPCQLCGAPIEVRYEGEGVETFCTECAGYSHPSKPYPHGYLGCKLLPPAGIRGRTPEESFNVAWLWDVLFIYAMANEVCPRCSGPLDISVTVCENHDATDGKCTATDEECTECGRPMAGYADFDCRNCIFDATGTLAVCVASDIELLVFLTTHGLNPLSPATSAAAQRVYSTYREEVVSVDPLEVRVTFTVDGDALTLTVDEDLSVVDVTSHSATESV